MFKQNLLSVLLVVSISVLECAARDWSNIYPRHPRRAIHPKIEVERVEERVVGGQIAEPHSFPHQVALFINTVDRTYFCGGSLISTRYVLTAAHCPQGGITIEVVLGAHNIRDDSESSQIHVMAENYIVHENYDSEYTVNDIALILLPEDSFALSDIIQTIILPTWSDVSNDFTDANSIISGWGKISDEETTYTDFLRYVEAPIISNEECRTWYFGALIEDTNICASGLGGKSPCNGDSGGALLVNGNKQVGITSFGIIFGCEVDFPGAYTRVTSYLDWIETHSDVIIQP